MNTGTNFLRKYFRAFAKPVLLILLYYAIIVWLCSFLWFTVFVSNGLDPTGLVIDPGMPQDVRNQLMGIVKDFGSFLSNMLRWNFGRQLNPSSSPIMPELLWRMKWTIVLICLSIFTYVVIGTIITIIATYRKPKKPRPITLTHSMKGFLFGLTPFIALMLLYIFVLNMKLFPRAGVMTVGVLQPQLNAESYLDILAHCILPGLTMAVVNTVRIIPIIWSSSSSLNTRSLWKLFFLSITTVDFALMVSMVIFVEAIFAFPGLGQWFLSSITQNNHTAAIASFIALLTITVVLGLVSSILDILQIKTGIREAIEKPQQYPEPKRQPRGESKIQLGSLNSFKRILRNKAGFIGIVILAAFVVIAITAPVLTPYQPVTTANRPPRVAVRYAAPSWYTIFPQYRNATSTIAYTLNLSKATLVNYTGDVEIDVENLNINFTPTGTGKQNATVTLDFGFIEYEYQTPPGFQMLVSYTYDFNRTGLTTYFIIKNTTTYPDWERYLKYPDAAEMKIGYFMPPPDNLVKSTSVHCVQKMDSFTEIVVRSLYNYSDIEGMPPNPEHIVFPGPGLYGVQVKFEFITRYPFSGARAELYLGDVELVMWGEVHGVLGTDFGGQDVWTELVYGVRTSLTIIFGVAAVATILGLPFGVLAGKFKGWTGDFVMIAAEMFLFIPIVPIILIHARFMQPSLVGWIPIVLWILTAITTIAYRNGYIANIQNNKLGSSKIRSLLRLSWANFFLTAISVFLILESIAFLGFGDPSLPSWGRMLYLAYQLGGSGSWWVWVTPIGFLLLLILGLFLVGSALDDI